MINSCKKGKAGERELAHKLNDIFGTQCRRGQQHTGLEGKDVVGLEGIHIECKRVQALNVGQAVKQAQRDAAEGEVPAVFHRKNNQLWLVTIPLETILKFSEAVLRNYTTTTNY